MLTFNHPQKFNSEYINTINTTETMLKVERCIHNQVGLYFRTQRPGLAHMLLKHSIIKLGRTFRSWKAWVLLAKDRRYIALYIQSLSEKLQSKSRLGKLIMRGTTI